MAAKLSALRYAGAFALLGLLSGTSSAAFAAQQLGPNTVLDTEFRAQGVDLDNGDLGTSGSDNVGTAALEARLRLTHHFNPDDLFFWEGRGVASAGNAGFESGDTGSVSNGDSFLEWRQSYFEFDHIGDTPVGTKLGRQKVREPYGVWWNQNFDAASLYYDTTEFEGMVTGGENLFSYRTGQGDFGRNEEDISNILASGSWQYYYQNFLEGRFQYQHDHSDVRLGDVEEADDLDDGTDNLVWLGLRATGQTRFPTSGDEKLAYRADLMTVNGDEVQAVTAPFGPGTRNVTAMNARDVSGWAFDGSVDVPLPHHYPILHLGYAFGSGDDNPGTTADDNGFRQSGLNGNFSRFGALTENTDNYGTVLRPELNNIHVLAAGATMPVLDASNAGVIYRYYRLDEAATSLMADGVTNTLNGVDKDLGQEVDLLFNMDILKETGKTIQNVEAVDLRSSLGFFFAGDAFGPGDGDVAVRGLVEVKIKL